MENLFVDDVPAKPPAKKSNAVATFDFDGTTDRTPERLPKVGFTPLPKKGGGNRLPPRLPTMPVTPPTIAPAIRDRPPTDVATPPPPPIVEHQEPRRASPRDPMSPTRFSSLLCADHEQRVRGPSIDPQQRSCCA